MRDRRGKEGGEAGKGPSPTHVLPARVAPEPQCPAGASALQRQARFAGTNPAAALAQHVGAEVLGGGRGELAWDKPEVTCGPVLLPRAGRGSSKGDLVLLAVLDLGL